MVGVANPGSFAIKFTARIGCVATIAEAMRAKLNPNPPDISMIMADVRALLDQ